MTLNTRILTVILFAAQPLAGMAAVRPAGLFTDNMVIQRETQAPIWGWADAGEKVTVTGSWGASAETTANEEGTWKVKLQTPSAGGPHTLTLEGNNRVELTNVLAGDVWLCSGQSNMQWPVARANHPEEEAKNANYPQLRHFWVQTHPAQAPAPDCKGGWQVCSPATVNRFSATAYFTGRELHKDLDIPIGLLTSAVGGTPIESWTPLAEQADDPFAKGRKDNFDKQAKEYTPEKAKAQFQERLTRWEEQAAQAKTNNKRRPRRPRLQHDPLLSPHYPGNLYNGMIHPLLPFAIKGALWYQGESNAGEKAVGASFHYRVQLDRLVRTWRNAWGQDIPFYTVQLPNFRQPQEMPVAAEDNWPTIRESFSFVAQNTPDVATATMIDLGEAGNVHPGNKQDVGLRMASTILNKTYGKETPTTPFMKSFAVEGNRVVLSFEYTGTGLVAKDGALKGFALAGADKQFVWADAEIINRDGADCVVVSSKEVTEPVAVRYAWADNPTCNLYSKEGFPASPFRTDAWDATELKPTPAKAGTLPGSSLKKNDTIVFLGDSITAAGARPGGYIALASQAIEKAYPDLNIQVVGAGKGGHKVPDCQKRLDQDVLQKNPTIVLIYIGINDVWHWTHPKVVARGKKGTTPEDFEHGLKEMIQKINGVGARVILCTPTVIGEKTDGTNPSDKMLDEYSDISRKVARETGSQLLDLREAFITHLKEHNPENAAKGILTGDSVHMNNDGNRLLSKLVLDALNVPVRAATLDDPAPKPAPVRAKKQREEKVPPTYAEVAYDDHERARLDFWQAEGEGPRPVLVHIHGGGWIQGDKRQPSNLRALLDKGISVAAIRYRLTGTDPLPAPVHDAVRAIQYIRYKANEWNIDKNRFLLTGGSAGGCSSVWIACHDDLADPDADDPVERESSRVQGIAVRGAQTSIDPRQVEPWIGPNVYHAMIYMAVGEESIEDALENYAKHEATYKEFSAYNHVSKDDPPLFLGYGADLTVPAKNIGHGIHHGMFGVKLKERSEEVGHNQVYLFMRGEHQTTEYANQDEFITRILLGE